MRLEKQPQGLAQMKSEGRDQGTERIPQEEGKSPGASGGMHFLQ